MEFLYLLEKIRNPFLDFIFSAITNLGGEMLTLGIGIFVVWCVNKKNGYGLLLIGFTGTIINQTLKMIFRIPRPWVKDPNFTIVESAREGATGYSFPSGHTQNVTANFGTLACQLKKRWFRITAVVIILLTALSRMYLGVHTPLDVGVSLVTASVLVVIFRFVGEWVSKKESRMYIALGTLLLIAGAFLLFILFYSFPADLDKENYDSALKAAYMIFGSTLGAIIGYTLDTKYVRFETYAVWWVQAIKFIVGTALVIGIKELLKLPLKAVFGTNHISDGIRYMIVVIIVTAVWPMTFKYFSKLSEKFGK